MKRIIKISIIMLILLSMFTFLYKINASGINMNLSNSSDNTTYGSQNNTATTNNTNRNNSSMQESSIITSNLSQNTSEGLTISDMINIILCAIGVILILLGIAILIRQRG